MKKLFIIGGMGAGKSTARKALVDAGLPYIDLDKVRSEERRVGKECRSRWSPYH